VHAVAGQRVQVHGQRGGQRLAFAGAHLGDLALVQRDAAHHLDVEVPHAHHALGSFAHHGEGLGQQVVEGLVLGQAIAELLRLGTQLLVGKRLQLRLEGVDLLDGAPVLLEQAVVAGAEDFGQEVVGHGRGSCRAAPCGAVRRRSPLWFSRIRWSRCPPSQGRRLSGQSPAFYCAGRT
jgi:hypothetical protein